MISWLQVWENTQQFFYVLSQGKPSQAKSSQLYLGRVALSAIGWYQKGPCVKYDYTIKIKKLKITSKLCTRILKSE